MHYARFLFLKAVSVKKIVCWSVSVCSLLQIYRHFGLTLLKFYQNKLDSVQKYDILSGHIIFENSFDKKFLEKILLRVFSSLKNGLFSVLGVSMISPHNIHSRLNVIYLEIVCI